MEYSAALFALNKEEAQRSFEFFEALFINGFCEVVDVIPGD
jgi:hypothetical protein